MIMGWFLTYPLGLISPTDWLLNHISIFYWFGLPITLVSLCIIGLRTKNSFLQCIVAICIFLSIHSLSYYYYMVPGSDAQLFRGLNEYFQNTGSLTSDSNWHFYYEWPLFFVLSKTATIVTGLELFQFEFLLYTLIGILIVLGLYVYFSKSRTNLIFLPIVGFSIAMFSFFNYQAVPFSLAASLFIIMLAVEKKFENEPLHRSKTTILILIFFSLSFTHLFVSIFFIFYLIMHYLLNRNASYLKLIFITITIYLAVQLFQAPVALNANVREIINNALSSDLSKVVQQTFSSSSSPIDTFSQILSRMTFLLSVSIIGLGFLISLLRKRLTTVDKAFFFSGLIYLLLGVFLPILGSRAIAFVFIPMSLGIFSFVNGRKSMVLKTIFLICLVLFTFVSVHQTFLVGFEVQFQTKEAYVAENFALRNYAWNNTTPPKVLVDFRQQNYLIAFKANSALFYSENTANFSKLNEYDCIIYTIGLAKILDSRDINFYDSIRNSSFDVIYSNGFSTIFINGQ
jgi:hypothetical protein